LVLFKEIITGNGYKVVFEHIKGKDNSIPNIFSHASILQESRKEWALQELNILALVRIINYEYFHLIASNLKQK